MDFDNQQKIIMGLKSIESFFDMLEGPNDIYKQILLEELIAFLKKEIEKENS